MSNPPVSGWSLTTHACRHCLSRVLEREDVFMCSSCEAQCTGAPDAICGCGMRPDGTRGRTGRRTDTFRCGENPLRSNSNPARVSILFGGSPVSPIGEGES